MSMFDGLLEFKEGIQGETGHVGFGPPLSTLLHVLLKLDPSETQSESANET